MEAKNRFSDSDLQILKITESDYPSLSSFSCGCKEMIVEFVAHTFSVYRVAGCQFVTVDAINNQRTLSFYQDKLGFEFQTVYDLTHHSRRMYLDIFSTPQPVS